MVEMRRTFSARFMREFGEDGITRWKNSVSEAIKAPVKEVNRIKSAHLNVTVFLERDE